MRRNLMVTGLAAAAVLMFAADSFAQGCTNSGRLCGKCDTDAIDGSPNAVGLGDARQVLLVALDIFGTTFCDPRGFGDYDFNGTVNLEDARGVLLSALDIFGTIPSCDPATEPATVQVAVTTTDANAFGADVTYDLPAGATPDTDAPGADSTGVEPNAEPCGPGGGETQDCKIAASNTNLAGQVRAGSATTMGFANDDGNALQLRVQLDPAQQLVPDAGNVLLPDIQLNTAQLYNSDGTEGGADVSCRMTRGSPDGGSFF